MSGFSHFIMIAGMRTGSNLLETILNAVPGVSCHGEAFNPHFVGYPNRTDVLGVDLNARDKKPFDLLNRIINEPGLNGFRYFSDHDGRVLERTLSDPACAKVILRRNPVDSFVSLQIARQTQQWKLTSLNRRKQVKVEFRRDRFMAYLDEQRAFYQEVDRRIAQAGQTAFHMRYDDLQDLETVNGLLTYLGVAPITELSTPLKRQNPETVMEKVSNPDEVQRILDALSLDGPDAAHPPELRRGPMVIGYVLSDAGLAYMPTGGPQQAMVTEALNRTGPTKTGLTQKDLRQWQRDTPGHRSFAVVCHPLVRAHYLFCTSVLTAKPALKNTLRTVYGIPLPDPGLPWTIDRHRASFLGFLRVLKANLRGQTSMRPNKNWATQSQHLQDMARFMMPDHVFRMERPDDLSVVGLQIGPVPQDSPYPLSDIWAPDIEDACRAAYGRDYDMLGYDAWRQAA